MKKSEMAITIDRLTRENKFLIAENQDLRDKLVLHRRATVIDDGR